MKATSETLTHGLDQIGTIISNERGHEAYGPRGEYIATYDTLHRARRALFDLHQASEAVEKS